MDPRLYARDQIKLVSTTMDLPDGERDKTGHNQDRSKVEGDQCHDFFARQGFCRASCGGIGIMF